MKRLFGIFLVISILLSTAYAAVPSPDLSDFYYFDPNIRFEFLTRIPNSFRLNYSQLFAMAEGALSEIDWDKFHIDEGFILYLDKPLHNVKFKGATLYNIEDKVYIVVVTQNRKIYTQEAFVSKDHAININFKDFPVEYVILLIITNH